MEMTDFCVESTVMDSCVPASARRTSGESVSSPGASRAAAKARAAFDRPEPGGPVSSHACVIAAEPGSAARESSAIARS